MSRPSESIHELAVRVRRAIAGDRDAQARYVAAGDNERAAECERSIHGWQDTLTKRLGGGK